MIMQTEDSYQPNETLYYHEAGQIFETKVIENKSNERYIDYTLRLTRQVSGPKFAEMPPGGLEIAVVKGQNACGATWWIARYPSPQMKH